MMAEGFELRVELQGVSARLAGAATDLSSVTPAPPPPSTSADRTARLTVALAERVAHGLQAVASGTAGAADRLHTTARSYETCDQRVAQALLRLGA